MYLLREGAAMLGPYIMTIIIVHAELTLGKSKTSGGIGFFMRR
jgi:hypothetical protein